MTEQKQLRAILSGIAGQLRVVMNADDVRDYMLSFLFLRYLPDNYEASARKEFRRDYVKLKRGTPLSRDGGPLAQANLPNALITAQTQKMDGLKTHKKGLMQQLFPAADEMNR